MLKHIGAFLIASFAFFIFLVAFVFISNSVIASMITSRGVTVVPNILGYDISRATQILENIDLKIEFIDSEYSEYPEGHIITQIPSSGREIYKNRTIQVIISRGAKIIDMPNLTGISFQNINEVLRTYELRLGQVSQHYSTEVPSGFIINTIPEPGQITMAGIEVNFIISIGRDPLDALPIDDYIEDDLYFDYF